ncbi:class I SAM-dependent methyltransferase [Euzebya rosea]|uniref:class I SAM-dependent methyltransferase n=1 Tax=Euzebya rosea TaxID=2052804 RepID=UPI000D3E357C|nr:class I SAM-dependent methyltransferase [Euzebya rosea]
MRRLITGLEQLLRNSPLWVPLRNLTRYVLGLLARTGLNQGESAIIDQSHDYWTREALDAPNMFHWRGEEGIGDDAFDRMGARNAARFQRFATAIDFPTSDLTVLEWGCGGGTNLRALAPHASTLYGVDVSPESLDEAERELAEVGPAFTPVLTTVADPEAALSAVAAPLDLFLCVNVMELIPSPEYGERILQIARQMLRPGGMALIQIRYRTGRVRTRPMRAFYRLDPAAVTTYGIDEFWTLCQANGLTPHLLTLEPAEEVIGDRYAYYALTATDRPMGRTGASS